MPWESRTPRWWSFAPLVCAPGSVYASSAKGDVVEGGGEASSSDCELNRAREGKHGDKKYNQHHCSIPHLPPTTYGTPASYQLELESHAGVSGLRVALNMFRRTFPSSSTHVSSSETKES